MRNHSKREYHGTFSLAGITEAHIYESAIFFLVLVGHSFFSVFLCLSSIWDLSTSPKMTDSCHFFDPSDIVFKSPQGQGPVFFLQEPQEYNSRLQGKEGCGPLSDSATPTLSFCQRCCCSHNLLKRTKEHKTTNCSFVRISCWLFISSQK